MMLPAGVRLSADGCVPYVELDDTGCCMPPLCGNGLCCTFVAFFNLLPSGPLWDYWKAAAISYFQYNDDPHECPLVKDPHCPSLVLHAIYSVLKLKAGVHNALWPAMRESNPYTAITSLDDWLARLHWEDCYRQHCRSVLLGEITPYELLGECGPVFCGVDLGPELECAVKRAIVIALTRANMSPIKTLCGLNWIIEPLGAELIPIHEITPKFIPQHPGTLPPRGEEECVSMCVEEPPQFAVCRTRDWIYSCGTGDVCDINKPLPKISASWSYACGKPAGLPADVWPGVLAAECIVRSMLQSHCPPNITSNYPPCC
jgi:hypothetical protein